MINNSEHILKMLLANNPDTGERCTTCEFSTENDALAYAYRLTKLEPGDTVFIRRPSGTQRGVFLRHDPECGAMAVVFYYDDDKELSTARVGYSAISLPNEVFIMEEQHD